MAILQGKGMYLWRVDRVENGNADAIGRVAKEAGLSHVLLKVADGRGPYNIDWDTNTDWCPPVVEALRARGIEVWGWQYIYGRDAVKEAREAIKRVKQFNLDGFVVNAEKEFKVKGMDVPAKTYMKELRSGIPNTPIGFSTYRYPSYHRPLPFEVFLEYSDINMPQVYWVQANNPGAQLLKSYREYQGLSVVREYFPTGAAYKEHGWTATPEQVTAFMEAVKEQGMRGCNFWEWSWARANNSALWDPVKNFDWPAPGTNEPADITIRFLDAVNSRDPVKVASLYSNNAVHVTGQRTIQGPSQILGWYNEMLKQKLPNASFHITGSSQRDNIRTVTWTAISSTGRVLDGKDSLGIKNDKIAYHYSYFTVQPS